MDTHSRLVACEPPNRFSRSKWCEFEGVGEDHMCAYIHIQSYTIIYNHIQSYTIIYSYTPSRKLIVGPCKSSTPFIWRPPSPKGTQASRSRVDLTTQAGLGMWCGERNSHRKKSPTRPSNQAPCDVLWYIQYVDIRWHDGIRWQQHALLTEIRILWEKWCLKPPARVRQMSIQGSGKDSSRTRLFEQRARHLYGSIWRCIDTGQGIFEGDASPRMADFPEARNVEKRPLCIVLAAKILQTQI